MSTKIRNLWSACFDFVEFVSLRTDYENSKIYRASLSILVQTREAGKNEYY